MPARLKFDEKHYVPILKTKRGELTALNDLFPDDRTRLTPLFELHPKTMENPVPGGTPKNVPAPVAQVAEQVCVAIAKTKTARYPMFLDTAWYDGKTRIGDPDAVAALFQEARNVGLRAIPVVRSSYDGPMLRQIRNEIARDRGGCLFRIRAFEFHVAPPDFGAMLAALDVKQPDVHLLIDYGSAAMQLKEDLALIPNISRWRTLTSASGAFPESLVNLQRLTWHDIPREDWTSWKTGLASDLPRKPTFSDYACRFTGRPPTGGRAGVNLRYAVKNKWLVQTSGLVSEGRSPDMIKICADLVKHPLFCKALHCAGDAQYASRVPPNRRPGSPEQWVQWSVNHHLTFVVGELARHAGS
jgi:hypothetical protein